MSTFQTCNGPNFIEPFDPRCRLWYQSAKEKKGQIFTQPYVDAITGDVLMTSSTEVSYDDGITKAVFAIDFVFKPQDKDLDEGYTVLFHEKNQTVFHHKNYNAKSGLLLSWRDIEFNSTGSEVFDEDQKGNFTEKVNMSLSFMKTGSYDIKNFNNVEGFYQRWQKGDRKFLSLFYPISVRTDKEQLYSQNENSLTNILLIGRVHKDISDLIKLVNVNQNPFFVLSIIIETSLMVVLIILFVLHYSAVQYQQVQIPLEMLIQFLKQNYQLQYSNNKQSSRNTNSKSQNYIANKKKSKFFVELLFISNYQNQQGGTNKKINDSNSKYIKDDNDNEFGLDGNSQRSRFSTLLKFSYFQKQQQKDNSQSIKYNQPTKEAKKNESFESLQSVQNLHQNLDDYLQKTDTNLKQKTGQEESKVHLNKIEPMFQEMSIILDTFQKLESVIQYAISESNKGSIVNSLIHFSNAKKTFQMIQNYAGLGMCYFKIGMLHISFDRYEEAIESFLASVHCSLQELNQSSLKDLLKGIQSGYLENQIYQLRLLSKRLLAISLVLKEQFKKQNGYNCFLPTNGDKNGLYLAIKYLKICICIIDLTYEQPHKSKQKQAIYIEISELYLLMDDCDNCVYYLKIIEQPSEFLKKPTEDISFIYNSRQENNKESLMLKNSVYLPQLVKHESQEGDGDTIEDSSLYSSNMSYLSGNRLFNQRRENQSPLSRKNNMSQKINKSSNNMLEKSQTQQQFPDCVSSINTIVLQRILSCREQYYYLGCNLLALSIESVQVYDPSIRYQAFVSLQTILLFNQVDCQILSEDIKLLHPSPIPKLKQNSNKNNQNFLKQQDEIEQKYGNQFEETFDIVIMLQNSHTLINEQISTQTNVLKFLCQTFLQIKRDRVSIITYNNMVKIIQPLVLIESKKQLNFCINQFKNEYDKLIYQYYQGKNQINFINQLVNPKLAYIICLNFFRSECNRKSLTSTLQKIKKSKYETIFNHPIFMKYLEYMTRPLINEYHQQYCEHSKKQDQNMIHIIQDKQFDYQNFLNNEAVQNKTETTQEQKIKEQLLFDGDHSQKNQYDSFSFIENKNYNYQYNNCLKLESNETEQDLLNNKFAFINNSENLEKKLTCHFNQALLSSKNDLHQNNHHNSNKQINQSFNTELNLIDNEITKEIYNQSKDMFESQKIVNESQQKKQSQSNFSNQKGSFINIVNNQNSFLKYNNQKKGYDATFGQIDDNLSHNSYGMSHQSIQQNSFIKNKIMNTEHKSESEFENQNILNNVEYIEHYERSLFNCLKVHKNDDGSKSNKLQLNSKPKQNRKQIMIFFSFTNTDQDDDMKNQIFQKLSFNDDIEVLHFTTQKSSPINQNTMNKSEKSPTQSQSQENQQEKINFKYNIFSDIQSLINYLNRMRSSKFYKYTLLSEYLNSDF